MPDAYDLVVLGGGTGGYAAALHAAGLGMSVALVEGDLLGGTCLHRGCIPTKALLHAAEIHDTVSEAGEFGISAGKVSFDWAKVQSYKQKVVDKMTKGLSGLVRHRKVDLVEGRGTLRSPGTVAVGDREISAKRLIVATGSRPKLIPGLDPGPRVITSDEALTLDRVPASAIVIGGGSVGVEFASIWRSFGADVTVVEMLPALLPLEDSDVSKELARAFGRRGIGVMAGAKVEDVTASDDSIQATVSSNGKTETLEAEILLVAVGRAAVTGEAGLENAGVSVDGRGFVRVRGACETTQAGVYAVGDILPTPQLAHVSFAEGIAAATKAAGGNPPPLNYDAVPRCTYCVPEVAAVGLTEAQARERGHDVATKTVSFAGIGKAAILGSAGGFCKIVAERDGAILGVHYVGPRVTELVAEAMLAVGWEAMPEEVASLIHPHPTLTESTGEAALALAGRALHTA